ncbi:hypothetical protein Bca52824_001059 [Brassica carinata]|uniref:Uncharacterized protein n=1 Tax=Brassica carinata TaxID=52824 RepID=A0A8X7WFL4_BRACI|nr:hypothetical protein Bca52824_001059 [Brassica carinata]
MILVLSLERNNCFVNGRLNITVVYQEILKKDIHEHFDNVSNEVAQLKEQVSQIKDLSKIVEKRNASEIMCPSATLGKDQGKSSHSPSPPAAKGKGKAAASVDPTPVCRSLRPVRQDVQNDENDMLDFLKNLSKTSRYVDKGTQESLQEAMENFSQAYHPADWRPPTLKDVESHEDRMHDPDYSLVFVHEELWAKLIEWTTTSKELKTGPSMLTSELASRVMGPTQWLKNHRKKENHLFKWVDEALLDEIERMAEHQARVDEEIEDL